MRQAAQMLLFVSPLKPWDLQGRAKKDREQSSKPDRFTEPEMGGGKAGPSGWMCSVSLSPMLKQETQAQFTLNVQWLSQTKTHR